MKIPNLLLVSSLLISLASLCTTFSMYQSSDHERAAMRAAIIATEAQPEVELLAVPTRDGAKKYTRCQGNWCVTDTAPVEPW